MCQSRDGSNAFELPDFMVAPWGVPGSLPSLDLYFRHGICFKTISRFTHGTTVLENMSIQISDHSENRRVWIIVKTRGIPEGDPQPTFQIHFVLNLNSLGAWLDFK